MKPSGPNNATKGATCTRSVTIVSTTLGSVELSGGSPLMVDESPLGREASTNQAGPPHL
ncbi:hypothetical protein ACFUAC_19455 [Streptomyces sp. NPDC057148]|uniref:hypothetical protein n=1 Tax=unclassified Streptomyces TaxID=2593676 RepID=UPI003627EB2E